MENKRRFSCEIILRFKLDQYFMLLYILTIHIMQCRGDRTFKKLVVTPVIMLIHDFNFRFGNQLKCARSGYDEFYKPSTLQHLSPHLGLILCMKNWSTQWTKEISSNEKSAPMAVEKSKSWGPFWSCQLNSIANSAHLAHFRGEQAELAVLFSWQLQNGPQNFDFFNCHGCHLFI